MAQTVTWRSKVESANTILFGLLNDYRQQGSKSFGTKRWQNLLGRAAKDLDHAGMLVESGRGKRDVRIVRLGYLLRAQSDLSEHCLRHTKTALQGSFHEVNELLRET